MSEKPQHTKGATPSNGGSMSVRWLDGDTIEVRFVGHVGVGVIAPIEAKVFELLEGSNRKPRILVDGSEMKGFDADCRNPAAVFIKRVKAEGLPKVVVAMNLSLARMVTSAISFAAGFPMNVVATRAEALAALNPKKE